MNKLIVVLGMFFWASAAFAQHNHGSMKGPNGGPMQDVAGVHAELVLAGNVITVNLLDEANKSASAKGFSGSLLIVSGGSRETVQLSVAGESALKGEAKAAVPAGAQITLMLRSAVGRAGQVRF